MSGMVMSNVKVKYSLNSTNQCQIYHNSDYIENEQRLINTKMYRKFD